MRQMRPYLAVPDALVDHHMARIGPHSYAVLIVLMRHADKSGQCSPSTERLASLTGMSRSMVVKSLRRLQEFGYVSAERRPAASSVYRLLPLPELTAAVGASGNES